MVAAWRSACAISAAWSSAISAVEPVDRVAHEQPEIGRHLVVARARGMEAPGGRTDQLGEPRFDVEMDVLVLDAERKGAALDRAANGAEPPGDGVAVFP